MDWEPDIVTEALTLEEHLLEITNNLNYSNAPVVRQSARDLLEQFHILQTTGYNFSPVNTNWVTPWDTAILSSMLEEGLEMLESLHDRVIREEIQPYGRQVASISPNPTKSLDVEIIQAHCELLLDRMQGLQRILNTLRDKLRHGNHQHHQLQLPAEKLLNFQTKFTSLFENFLRKALIVEQQPPQVMKINTKFPHPPRLRWLVGDKVMSLWEGRLMNGSPVEAQIVSEAQARVVDASPQSILPRGEFKSCGILSSDRSKPEFTHEPSGLKLCVINYRPMHLKRIHRDTKKVKRGQSDYQYNSFERDRYQSTSTSSASANPISVTDEKFCIFFYMQIEIGGKCLIISTLSQPFVVITHGSQEPYGWATMTWDIFFANLDRHPFDVPESVPWSKVADMLNYKFHQATERGLDARQLSVLRSKLVPESFKKTNDEAMITFSSLAKEPMSNGSLIGFWEWFYGCVKLTEKHFPDHWKNGAIYGFISRNEAEEILKGWPPGTFMLRFSDTVLGGISICYVASNGSPYSLAPFTTKDLTFRSLSNTLWDLTNLTALYPTRSKKEDAFPHHCTTSSNSCNYSVLKGVFAQQSQSKKSNKSSGRLVNSASSSAIGSLNQVKFSPPKTSRSTSKDDGILTKKSSTSEYVVSYPRICIPQQFI